MKKIDRFVGRYEFLSNFYLATITYNGLVFSSAEAAFQAQKCTDLRVQMQFQAMSPRQAKALGRKVILRPDWEDIKLRIMYQVLQAKFNQNQNLTDALLRTAPAYIEEGNTWNDTFWGVCHGTGLNHLGHLLMKVRDELSNR